MTQRRFFMDDYDANDVLAVFADREEVLTRREIALRMGMSKTTKLIALIEQMCADGLLVRSENVTHSGVVVFLYQRTQYAQ